MSRKRSRDHFVTMMDNNPEAWIDAELFASAMMVAHPELDYQRVHQWASEHGPNGVQAKDVRRLLLTDLPNLPHGIIGETTKTFVVASVSDNLNSFGLQGIILVAQDGEAWQAGANSINVKPKGTRLRVAYNDVNGPDWARLGFEIPEKLPTCPPGALREVLAIPQPLPSRV